MATFDLGPDLLLVQAVHARLEVAYALSRRVVLGYEGMGYSVIFIVEQPPAALRAEIRSREGTRLQADLTLEGDGRVSHLRIQLRGSVVVGGVQGMFATPAMVRQVARQRLSELLERTFEDVGGEPSVEDALDGKDVPASSLLPGGAEGTSPAGSQGATADSKSPPAERSSPDALQRSLETIKILRERELITEDDYARKKRALLELL